MAKDTFLNLRNQIIYCINVRNHTPEGTFNAIIPDLQRIKGWGPTSSGLCRSIPSVKRSVKVWKAAMI